MFLFVKSEKYCVCQCFNKELLTYLLKRCKTAFCPISKNDSYNINCL